MRGLVSRQFVLATADDLDGTSDNTQAFNVTGCSGVIIFQVNDGTAGTAGIDVLQVSHDGGSNWAADDTVLAIDANAVSGTIAAGGALNAAGVEPATVLAGVFKAGPWEGPTAIRISRKTGEGGTTWVTGSPSVTAVAIGLTAAAPSALA
jgi:hypothetical protein